MEAFPVKQELEDDLSGNHDFDEDLCFEKIIEIKPNEDVDMYNMQTFHGDKDKHNEENTCYFTDTPSLNTIGDSITKLNSAGHDNYSIVIPKTEKAETLAVTADTGSTEDNCMHRSPSDYLKSSIGADSPENTNKPLEETTGNHKEESQSDSGAVQGSNKVFRVDLNASNTGDVEKPFKCPVCRRGFKARVRLSVHLTKHRRNNCQMYPCDECGLAFIKKKQLQLHKKVYHRQRLLYSCEYCAHRSLTETTLASHIVRFHSEERHIISCSLCGRTFQTCIDFAKHMRIHEKCEACDVCGKIYQYRRMLLKHKEGHTHEVSAMVACDICGKRHSTFLGQGLHKLLHSEDGPYFCPYCGKKFNGIRTLVQHQKVHTTTIECPIVANIPSSYDESEGEIQPYVSADMSESTAMVTDVQDNMASGGDVASLSSCESDYMKYCMAIPRTEIKIEECPKNDGYVERNSELDPGVTGMQVWEGISETDSCEIKVEVTTEPSEIKVEVTTEPSGISFPVHSIEGLEGHAATGFLEVGKFEAEADETTADFGHREQMQLSYIDAVNMVNAEADEIPQKCSLCGGTFKNEDTLAMHMQRHRQAKYTCDECGESFPTQKPMAVHKKTFHPKKKFVCKICGRKCKKQSCLDEHIEQHEFVNKHINEGTKRTNCTVIRMPKTANDYSKNLYTCHFCPCIYACRLTMRYHLASQHRKHM